MKQEIFFEPIAHRYFNEKNETYISCTQLVELFVPEFDKEFWLLYKALQKDLGYPNTEEGKTGYKSYLKAHGWVFADWGLKNINKLRKIAEKTGTDTETHTTVAVEKEWKQINKEALTKGTNFHNTIEAAQLGSNTYKFEHSKEKVKVINDFSGNLLDIRTNGIIPELRIYNHKYRIAGTSDQPYFDLPYVDVNDWKSNKVIKTENKFGKMLHCLSHLDDTNFNHYNIQLSLYAWMLEQYGYKPRNIGITHILFHNDNTPSHHVYYPMKYLKKEIEEMLEYYDQHLRK